MFSSSSWLHLRIPFSYFLLPVFLFALAISPNISGGHLFWVFIIVHIFLYPASNGYNSYFDKDEKSIGGLQNPPPVNKGLYYLSLSFDAIAITLGLVFINIPFAAMLFAYGLVLTFGERFGLDREAQLLFITVTTVVLFNIQFWSLSDPSVENPERHK